jgi:regulator of replication initiation timing
MQNIEDLNKQIEDLNKQIENLKIEIATRVAEDNRYKNLDL